jgi:hypothetical protein
MAKFSKKTSIILSDRGDPKYPVMPDVDLAWFDDLDKVHAQFSNVSIDNIDNTFDIRVETTDIKNKMTDPLTKVKRVHPTGGGAFYSYFVRQICPSGSNVSVYDFQKSYNSFCSRVLSGAKVSYKNYYNPSAPGKSTITVDNNIKKFDFVLSYFNMDVLSGDTMRAFFSAVDKDGIGILFYFDPYSAARDKNLDQTSFTFLKRDTDYIYYTFQGVDYVDPVIRKENIINTWRDYYDISFLTLHQFAITYNYSGMRSYVFNSRGRTNMVMWKHCRVMCISRGSTEIIEGFGGPFDYNVTLLSKPSVSRKAVRPMMMTAGRLDSCSSGLTWMTTKIDGYQAIIVLKKSTNKRCRDDSDDKCNVEFHFRNGKCYGARIPYKGDDYQLQATVLLDNSNFPKDLKITHVYYEDMIMGRHCVGSTFSQRAFYSRKLQLANFNFIMKKWVAYSGTLIDIGTHGEGLVFQKDCLYRTKTGKYYAEKEVDNLQTCFYLSERYTVDVSIYKSDPEKDYFVLDGVEYSLPKASSKVREVYIKSWDPIDFVVVRDRTDRQMRFYTHHDSQYNSCNAKFVSDLLESVTIKQAKTLLTPAFNIEGSLELFYLYYRNGGTLTDISTDYIPSINILISTGHSVLFYNKKECDHGFYVWRDHFQRIDLEDLEASVDFENVMFG